MNPSDAFELLNIDEFAKRFMIGRTTIFKWKQDGTLIPGRHYIQKGKIVRYIWARDVIEDIHQKSERDSEQPKNQVKIPIKERPRAKNSSAINLKY
jgi:hypothetical protein